MNTFIDGLFCGVVGTILIIWVACQFVEGSWDKCTKSGHFTHDNQRYECRATGQWVED